MGMDDLIATLEREAEERCAGARETARREAEKIRREADERLERKRAEAAEALEAELDAREEAALAEARTATRAARLRARRRALDRVFRHARELLPGALRRPAYLASLPAALEGALACLPEDHVEIVCSPGLVEELRDAARSAAGRDVDVRESDAAPAGFLARGAESGVEVDATLATRLESARPDLEREVLADLEAAGGEG